MPLPKIELPKGTVDLDGVAVQVHGLTRGDAGKLQQLVADEADGTEIEILILGLGTDTPEDEAREWYNSVPAVSVALVLTEIQRLSGMGEARFQPGESPSAG